MTLTIKDKQEVAAMIARAVISTTPVVEPEDIETTAQGPQSLTMTGIKKITFFTYLLGVNGFPKAGAGTTRVVRIGGVVNGEAIERNFTIQESDQEFLSELRRLQSYPHLFQYVSLVYTQPREGEAGMKFITKLTIGYEAE